MEAVAKRETISTKMGVLNNRNFAQALTKLASYPKFPVRVAYTLGKIEKEVQKHQREAGKVYQSLLEKFAKRDEEGKVIADPNGMGFELDPENQKAFEAEQASLMETPVLINFYRVAINDVSDAGLSGRELMALEDFLEPFNPDLLEDSSASA